MNFACIDKLCDSMLHMSDPVLLRGKGLETCQYSSSFHKIQLT